MNNTKQVKLPKVAQYVKNVGKSLALISIDSVKDYAPSTTEFIENNDEYIKKSFAYVRNARQNMNKAGSDINKGRIFQAVESGFRNMKSDIASGNFYNTARLKQEQEDMFMSSMGLDDDDYDFDFSFDDDNDTSSSKSSIADSFNKAIGAAASSSNNAITGASELIFRGNKASTQALVANMDKVGAHINAGLGSIYSNIGITNKFLETHISNSNKFYEDISKSMNEQVAMTKELLEMQRNLYKGVNNNSYSSGRKSGISKSMNYDGSINLEGYVKNVVSNLKNYDTFGLFEGGDKDDIFNPMNILISSISNPLPLVLGALGKGMMPKNLKKSIKNFDKGFSSAFSQIITSVNKHKDDYGIMGILANIFGADLDKKSKIDPSKFNKGAIPFDGVTKQAIIETIPGYLSRIEAALTGSTERHYNYDTGRWTNIDSIHRNYKQSVQSSIARANYDIKSDTDPYLREIAAIDPAAAKSLEKSIFKMMTKIYEDDGYFRKDKVKSPGGTVEAWKYYGFKDKKSFDKLFGPGFGRNSIITEDTLRQLAARNISAKQDFSASRRNEESKAHSIERQLVNEAYSLDLSATSKNKSFKGGTGLLSISRDKDGHNVFWYLRNILSRLGHGASNANGAYNNRQYARHRSVRRKSSSTSASSSDSDDSDPDADDDYAIDESIYRLLEEEELKKLNERDSRTKNKDKLGDKFRAILEKSAFGKFLNKSSSFIGKMFEAPVNAVTNLLNKTNDNLMKFVFGDTKDRPVLRDADGNEIEGLLPYMAEKVRQTFIKVTKDIKEWMNKVFHLDSVKNFAKDKWNTYGAPILNESKSTLKKGYNRVREGLDNTLGNGFRKISSSLKNRSIINSNDIKNGSISDDGTIQNSARGRIVTKRGLTMISPGEIIIPRSFDKKEQQKDLINEKKEKKRILDSLIGYNASGTIDVDKDVMQMKETLKRLMKESKGKSSKLGSGALLGAGAGLITGFGPIIGAAAGAGLSMLSYSETAKKIVFGDEIVDKDGNISRNGGIISKKIQDKFKKYANDSLDFGIAGGVLGLVTGMGPLTGSAIGAGIGLLKNSESFKKFIFGDEMNPNDKGIIDKDSFDKFKAFAKKSAPNMAIGAVAGILTGPFGILGNSVIGSGLGLLSATDTFKKFVFGDRDDPNSEGGLAGVFKNSVVNPMKDNMRDIMSKFKEFADKHILAPLKDFWNPFKQMIKNTISDIGDSITDIAKKSFEKLLGTPAMEFMRERLFKPLSKVALGALSVPAGIVGGIGLGGIKLLGGIGNNIRMGQINKGSAYDMSAAERLEFRNKHSKRNKLGFLFGKDRSLEQDEYFANMSVEDLKQLRDTASTYTSTRRDMENAKIRAKMSVQNKMSKFVNTRNSDGKNLYDLLSPSDVNKITKYITQGDTESFAKIMAKPKIIKALGPAMHGKLLDEGNKYIENIAGLEGGLKAFDKSQEERDQELKSILGDKFELKGKRNMKHLRKLAEAELKARGGINQDSEEFDLDNMETVESKATDKLTDLVKESSTKLFTILSETNDYLKSISGKDHVSNKGTPADRKSNVAADIVKKDTNSATDLDKPTSAKSGVKRVISGVTAPKEGEVRQEFIPAAGKYAKFIVKNGDMVESDDSDTQQALSVVNRSMELQEQTAENTKSTGGVMSFMKEKLFGKKEKEKEGGFLGSIGSKLGMIGKVLGVGMVAAPLLAPLGKWFMNKAFPAIKTLLFGKKEENSVYGYSSTGLLGGLYTSFRRVMFGDTETGEPGLFDKFASWMSDDKKGFPAIIRKTIPHIVNGIGYVFNNLITPITASFIQHLPTIAMALGKGILNGVTSIFKRKEMQDDRILFAGMGGDQISKDIQKHASAINSNLKSDIDPEIAKHFELTNISSPNMSTSGGANTTGSSDIPNTSNGVKETKDIYKKSFSLKGLLGETKNTNDVIFIDGEPYQADGTAYDRFNTHSSMASRLLGGAERGLIEGIAGNTGSGILRHLANKNISKIGRFGPMKLSRKAIGAGEKIIGKVGLASNNLGGKINNMITGGDVFAKSDGIVNRFIKNKFDVDSVGELATKVAPKASGVLGKAKDKLLNFGKTKAADAVENVAKGSSDNILKSATEKVIKNGAEEITEKTMESGFKGLFKKLVDSKIGSWILEKAAKYTKAVIKKGALSEAFEKMAEALAKKGASKLAQKGLKTIAGAIANFSVIGIALVVIDFFNGYRNTETYLGVAKGSENVTFVHKIICGLINVLTERFTFGLIPTELIVDIFGETLFPLFGMDMEGIEQDRAKATEIMNEYNKAHPEDTYDNLEDFNNKDRLWSKVKKKFKKTFSSKKKVSNTSNKNTKPASTYTSGPRVARNAYTTNGVVPGSSYLHGGGRNSTAVGRGMNHIYQSDASISGIGYGDSTIGDAGCGPVAATNLINRYNGNTSASLYNAAKFAETNGMTVPGGGTTMNYFNSYLNSNGIGTATTNNRNTITNALKNGNQVIMLGQDNTDKPGSPFGTNPHYVTAVGLDRNGNIIAEDPDLPNSSIVYNKNKVLNSMINSVVTANPNTPSGRARMKARHKIINYGRSRSGKMCDASVVLAIARNELGTEEGPNPNQVKYNYAYYDSNNAYGSGYAWCAAFLWWVFHQAGAAKLFCGGNRVAYVPTITSYYRGIGKFNKSNPQPGDLIIVGDEAHVAMVDSIIDSHTVRTIEGNWDNKVLSRALSYDDIYGFCHIDYPYEYDPSCIIDMSKYNCSDNTDYSKFANSTGNISSNNGEAPKRETLFNKIAKVSTSIVKGMYGEDAYNALFGNESDNAESNIDPAVSNGKPLSGANSAEKIWNYLRSRGYTPAGTAGLMGNLRAESGLKTDNVQDSYESAYGDDETYTNAINSKSRSRNSFTNDEVGYGLAQWTYNSRKAGLYDHTVGVGKKINDLEGQVSYLIKELENDYPGVNNLLKRTNSVDDASDKVLIDFERPAVPNYSQRRSYSNEYYSRYANSKVNPNMAYGDSVSTARPGISNTTNYAMGRNKTSIKYGGGATKALRSNMAYSNDTNAMSATSRSYTQTNRSINPSVDYVTFLQTIITVLIKISDNTALLSSILNVLSENLNIEISKNDIDKVKASGRAEAASAISNIINKSGGASNVSSALNNKDTQYILQSLTALAKE